MKTKVYINNDQKKIETTPAMYALIRRSIKATLLHEHYDRDSEASVTLVDNEKIHELNSDCRGIDRVTDVLSFPMFDDDFDDGEAAILGDIVLSLEKAKAQAEEYDHSFEREIAFLIVHSTLHLLGYDHEAGKAEESEMFALQKEILNEMGITRD